MTADRTPAGYIATDADQPGAIYGIGSRPHHALADALREAGYVHNDDPRQSAPPEFGLVAATARLISSVKANGGGPRDQDWSVYHGDEPTGATLPTNPSDVRDWLVADLDDSADEPAEGGVS